MKKSGLSPTFLFCNMVVIADMVLAVAMVSLTLGTIAELQFRIGHIRTATDGASVIIGRFYRCGTGLIGAGRRKWDRLAPGLLRPVFFLSAEQPGSIGTPGHWEHILDIGAKEEEIVGDGHQREQAEGEISGRCQVNKIKKCDDQVKQSKNPRPDGDNKEQHEMGIRVQRGIAQKQAQVQIGHIRPAANQKTKHIHQQHTGKIKQVKPTGSPNILHRSAQGIITHKPDQGKQNVAGIISQNIAEQPPNLSLQDQIPVKAKNLIQQRIIRNHIKQKDKSTAQADIHHQVWNAFVAVFIAEALEISAEVFQVFHLP